VNQILSYKYRTTLAIESEYVPKLEEMLKVKLKATSVGFLESDGLLLATFTVDNSRKFYGFKKVVENYHGRIIRWLVEKSEKIVAYAE
jgi:hypothetical protein